MNQYLTVSKDGEVNTSFPGAIIEVKQIKGGYLMVYHMGSGFRQHRLVMDHFQPDYPPELKLVDHINGIRDDNRLINLRRVSPSLNNLNRAGVLGCYFENAAWLDRNIVPADRSHFTARHLWIAHFTYKGVKQEVGAYKYSRQAILASRKAKELFICQELQRIWAEYELDREQN